MSGNRNPVAETRFDRRVDPYWGGLWQARSGAAWIGRADAEAMAEHGIVRGAVSRPGDQDEALFDLVRGRRRAVQGPAVAAVNQWRTMTTEQLAAFTGEVRLMEHDHVPETVARMFRAGLADVGRVPLPGRGQAMPYLVRTAPQGSWELLRELVDFDQWVGLTAGQPVWRWGSQHERHNVLTTEVGLRAAETLDVPCVFGEQLSAVRAMQPPGWDVDPHASNLGGDAMLVRPDGLRVMVETSANSNGIQAKMDRWADLVLADRTRTMVVVFLHAPHPSVADEARRRKEVKVALARAAHRSIEHTHARVAERMFFASWRSWFPGFHEVSPSWHLLRAQRPTGDSRDWWRDADVLDPMDVPGPLDAGAAMALVENAPLLWCQPHWMRSGASVSQVWMHEHGVDPWPRVVRRPGQ